jgi:hypothetical protein
MASEVKKRFDWRSRKVRAAVVVCLASTGLAAGFFGGLVRSALANEPPAGYCSFQYAGNDSKVENCPTTTVVPYKIGPFTLETFYYECVPCPPEAAPCSTGGAAGWVNQHCGVHSAASDYVSLTGGCTVCTIPPP